MSPRIQIWLAGTSINTALNDSYVEWSDAAILNLGAG